MVKRFLDFIKKHQLYQAGDKVLLAVSGGVDSVVLCHLFYVSKIDFAIAHMNFGLRGQDSIDDEIFVKQLGNIFSVAVHTSLANTKEMSTSRGISIQMAAREIRYNWFVALQKEFDYASVATAHHLNDSIETVLLNLTKGTGIAGLHGILPRNNDVIRPMLFASKEDIIEYAKLNHLQWREDSSNTENKYQRNLIRNKVIPLLKEINPSLETTFKQTLERLQMAEDFYDGQVAVFKSDLFQHKDDEIFINIHKLLNTPNYRILLLGALKAWGFSFSDLKNLTDGDFTGHKTFVSKQFNLVTDHEKLIIFPKRDLNIVYQMVSSIEDEVLTPTSRITFSTTENKDLETLLQQKNLACLDFDTLKFPLTIRNWKDGDRFRPYGLKGRHKNVSDFLNECKVPSYKKKDVLVMISGADIVWVVGFRISEKYQVRPTTQQVCVCTEQNIS